jgi:hypothetical protein
VVQQAQATQQAQRAAATAAPPNCSGQSLPYTDKLSAIVGSATFKPVVTCPVTDSNTGDLSQQTQDGGTLYQRASTGYSIFTNGSTHWAYAVDPDGTPDAYVWTSGKVDPPDGTTTVNQQKADAAAAAAQASAAQQAAAATQLQADLGTLSTDPCQRAYSTS